MLTIDEVKEYLDKGYELVYLDYQSNFNDSAEEVQTAIHKQDLYALDTVLDDWYMFAEMEGVDYAITELKKELSYNFDQEDIDEFFEDEDNYYAIEEEILSRNTSDPIKDMVRYTDDPVCFLYTPIEVPYGVANDDEEYQATIKEMKEFFNITDSTYDEDLEELIINAPFGGDLVVFFNGDINALCNIGDNNTVTFKNANIAIIDTMNGSGHNVQLNKHEFSMPFELELLRLDKTIRYNYTYAICGMYSNWCEDTQYSFSKTEEKEIC